MITKPELKPGPRLDKNRASGLVRLTLSLAVLIVVAAAVYLHFRHSNTTNTTKGKKSSTSLATVYDEQARYQQAINNNLKSGNVLSYMNSELELANGYISANDFNNAQSTLQAVQKNVPSDKLSSYYYQLKVQVDQHNKDNSAQKNDLQTLVAMLKSSNQTQGAAYYQKQLDKL